MNPFALPWLEFAFISFLIGAGCVSRIRDARLTFRVCIGFVATAFGCTVMAAIGHSTSQPPATVMGEWWGRVIPNYFAVDDWNAPLLPLVVFLHLLIAFTTARVNAAQFSFNRLMVFGAIRLAIFSCVAQSVLAAFLVLEAALPLFVWRHGKQSNRLFAILTALFVGLIGIGTVCVLSVGWTSLGTALVLLAVLIRTGVIPTHVWVTELYERGSFGSALLMTTPLVGIVAAVRIALPVASDWILEGLGIVALVTAFYAAGMGMVQTDARRYFAYLFISHASLVLVGVGLHTPFALTGALVMWPSVAMALTGLGFVLRSVEARVGTLDLSQYRGLYDQVPGLAICFLLSGLAAVGFPGTTGFIAIELLVDEAVGAHVAVGLAIVLTSAMNGIGIVRTYLLLFTGRRHTTGVDLGLTIAERASVLAVAVLILGGGLFPQVYLEARHQVALRILEGRQQLNPNGAGNK